MVTLSYGSLFGLLLVSFIVGLITPLFLLVYFILKQNPD